MTLSVKLQSVLRGGREILHDIDLRSESGTRLVVLGRNGSGKSTLLSVIASLIPFAGEVRLEDALLREMAPRQRARLVSALLQETAHPTLTVRELVTLGREVHRTPFVSLGAHDREMIDRAMKQADLEALADRPCDRLSGGELRRAYFGLLLAQDTPVVLLDEATAFMDADHAGRFHALADGMAREGKCVISVMHDLAAALSHADRILLLDGGTQRFFGSPEELLNTALIEEIFAVKRYTCGEKVFFTAEEADK